VSIRRKRTKTWLKMVVGVLLMSALLLFGSTVRDVPAQLDLSVFQKEGVSEEEQSKDRYECHTHAVQRTGFDPAVRPPDDAPPMSGKEKSVYRANQSVEWRKQQLRYNDALKRCMTERGYRIDEH
jgi:hypothetical protein